MKKQTVQSRPGTEEYKIVQDQKMTLFEHTVSHESKPSLTADPRNFAASPVIGTDDKDGIHPMPTEEDTQSIKEIVEMMGAIHKSEYSSFTLNPMSSAQAKTERKYEKSAKDHPLSLARGTVT